MDENLCGRKHRRDVRLRFQRTCRLRWVEKITNEMEIIDMWYALDDTRRFRREFEQESITEMSDYYVTRLHEGQERCRVRMSQDLSCQNHSTSTPTPSPGRNVHQSKERRRRKRQSQQSRDVVFKEQYFQYGCGTNDPETIAQRYYEVSAGPLKEALERAQRILLDLNNDGHTGTYTWDDAPVYLDDNIP